MISLVCDLDSDQDGLMDFPPSWTPTNSSCFPRALFLGLLACLLPSCTSTPEPAPPIRPSASEPVSFTTHVKPLLESSCLACHNGATAAGDLDLRNRDLAMRPSPNGPFIVPGYPDRSKIYRVVSLSDQTPGAMPPTGHALSADDVEVLRRWIAEGAHWPSGPEGTLAPPTDMNWRSR